MNRKFRKAMAIVSLIFMALFTVALILSLVNPKMFNGSIGYIALFTGFIGLSVFFVIKLSDKSTAKKDEITPTDGADEGEKPLSDARQQKDGEEETEKEKDGE